MFQQKKEMSYKEYLRQCGIYDPLELANLVEKAVELPTYSNEELCCMNFKKGHKWIFGTKCIFAHSIGDIREPYKQSMSVSDKNVRLFKKLNFWVTNIILSFMRNEEILGMRTVNREAQAWCQKAYQARIIELSKITLKTAQFFKRAVTLEVNHDSSKFFEIYKDRFFNDILDHFSNLRILKIDLNEVFDDSKKEKIIDKLTEFPLKIQIEEVMFIRWKEITERDLNSIVSTNFLENVSRLCLSMNNIVDKNLTPIVTAKILRNLKELDLSSNQLTDKGIEILVVAEIFENLRSLNLSINRIENGGMKLIAQTKAFPQLEWLELATNKISKKGIYDFAISGNYPNLKRLVLRNNKIKVEGAKELNGASNFKSLETLDLNKCKLEDDGCIHLMKSHSLLKNIIAIDLSENGITNSGIEIISKNSHLQYLTKLYIAWNSIQDAGFSCLANSNFIKNLTVLDIRSNKLTEQSATYIIESQIFWTLQILNISNNSLGPDGAAILASASNLTNLQTLDISHNKIGTNGWKMIAKSDSFPMLSRLKIFHGNEIDEFGKKMIQKSKCLKNLVNLI
jgi:Leucine-rich repeat (LRR) protein